MIKVLIVEDDPMVAELNRRYMERVEGFLLVAVVRSADQALELLKTQEVNLILLDVFMPGMNGLELLTKIREMGSDVDAIVVTAACDRKSIQQAMRYGAMDYLVKPFDFERLSAALLGYRDKVKFLRTREVMDQSDIDQRVLPKKQSGQVQGLPKGLDRNTLKVVWEHILSCNSNVFTTEEIANRVGISRVSMRKYLEFLEQIHAVEVEIVYGSIGRPVYRYHCSNRDSGYIKHYL